MATRRQKLRDIFRHAVSNGETVQDLLDKIEAFTAAGKSGIEPFINETLAAYTVVSAAQQELAAAQAALNEAQARVAAAQAAVN